MLQTLSGRTPKPPDRYQEEDTTTTSGSGGSKKEKGANAGKQRHKSSSSTVVINKYGVKNEDSSDDEITFTSAGNSKSQACSLTTERQFTNVLALLANENTLLYTLQISPSLSVSSNSSRKGKVGITIKKSPDTTGGERGTKFETSLLGGSSSEVRKGKRCDQCVESTN